MVKKKKGKFKFKSIYLLAVATFLFAASLILTNKDIVPGLNSVPQPGNNAESAFSKEKIEISGVNVADFINESGSGEQPSFFTIARTADYHFFYIPDQELFYISITSYPFDDFRLQAEQQLLSRLEITEEEACMLNVDIATPVSANPAQAGHIYGLSFCE